MIFWTIFSVTFSIFLSSKGIIAYLCSSFYGIVLLTFVSGISTGSTETTSYEGIECYIEVGSY